MNFHQNHREIDSEFQRVIFFFQNLSAIFSRMTEGLPKKFQTNIQNNLRNISGTIKAVCQEDFQTMAEKFPKKSRGISMKKISK